MEEEREEERRRKKEKGERSEERRKKNKEEVIHFLFWFVWVSVFSLLQDLLNTDRERERPTPDLQCMCC